MKIPVLHDDQHGTAIVVGATVLNALRCVGKRIEDIRIVSTGGGAAGIACLNLLVSIGARREKSSAGRSQGRRLRRARKEMTPQKALYAQTDEARTLAEAIGWSRPVSRALRSGDPHRRDGQADGDATDGPGARQPGSGDHAGHREGRPAGRGVATGRSDFPNQVNNLLCFPFIFRGALDVGATAINEEMKLACVQALADLAMQESSEIVAEPMAARSSCSVPSTSFPNRSIRDCWSNSRPRSRGRRWIGRRHPADRGFRRLCAKDSRDSSIARNAHEAGVRQREAGTRKHVVYAEGEDERVLRAVQTILHERAGEADPDRSPGA